MEKLNKTNIIHTLKYGVGNARLDEIHTRLMDIAKEEILKLGLINTLKAWVGGAVINMMSPSLSSNPAVVAMDRPRFYETKGDGFFDKTVNFLLHEDNRVYLFLMLPAIVLTIILRFIFMIGVWKSIKLGEYDGGRLIVLLIYFTYVLAITGPVVGAARYRLPIEPILIIFTSIGIYEVLRKYKKR